MSAKYIKLAKAPEWVLQYPQCSACMIDLFTDGDGWLCESCGTAWDYGAGDGDRGELYEAWSGEKLDGDPVTEYEAMEINVRREVEERCRRVAELMGGDR